MSNLYNKIVELCESRDITGYRLCKDIHARPSMLTDLKMGRKEALALDTLSKIANYFSVSVDYLLGNEQEKKPTVIDDELNNDLNDLIKKFRAAASPQTAHTLRCI